MPRKFNIFCVEVVVYSGEQFEWVVTSNEDPSNAVVQVLPASGQTLPLTSQSFNVTPAAPASATVNGAPGTEATFQCNPAAPNVTSQKIIVACGPFQVCSGEVTVSPGQHFVWQNSSTSPVTVTPSPANPNFWPLKHHEHTVPASGFLAVHVPSEAKSGQNYDLVVSGCDKLTQPKIIVQ